MGRGKSSQSSSTQFIAVDLAHPSQVAAAASTLADQWYGGSKSSSSLPGIDIVINNAGVFTGAPPGASICLLDLHIFLRRT
jgi:NAD(P)-dependent dehydrogenase (short-subunit alcohol dehydrogenase family)